MSDSSSPLNTVDTESPVLKPVSLSFAKDVDDLYDSNENVNSINADDEKSTEVESNQKNICQRVEVDSGIESITPITEEKSHNNSSSPYMKMKPYVKEATEENKSPGQQWVDCVIPDSGEDLSLLTQDSVTNREAECEILETRTPLVEWHQDDNFVFLHIKLPALTEYEFHSDITSLSFR